MAQSRFYSATAQPTVLTASLTPSDTIIQVQQDVGYPSNVPYIIALDYGSPSEEVVLVTNKAGLSWTVTRAYDGTSATAHDVGAAVRHTWSAIDGTDSRVHEGSTSGVHGVIGNLVGETDTQTLTNKTLTSPIITGTVAGSASYTTPTIVSPTITGAVSGGASYASPTITGTVAGAATYSNPTDRDSTHTNSAIGLSPLFANAMAGTTADIEVIQNNGTTRRRLSANGTLTVMPASGAGTGINSNGASGFTGSLLLAQLNSVTKFAVNELGNIDAEGTLTVGNANQFTVSATGDIATSGIGQVLFARRTSDLDRTSTIVRIDDPQLTLSVAANATYELSGYLIFDADAAGDFAMNFTSPAGSVLNWTGIGQGNGATTTVGTVYTANTTGTGAVAFGGVGAGTNLTVSMFGNLRTTGTAGSLTLQWAQSVSNAVATTLLTDSTIILRRVA